MASINGVSSSNSLSSLMNSANMISGLASGLDTESMIEGLVKSYQTKINTLNQKVTKTEWKQDAYRSIISKMVGFSSKYTSYTSSTNLMSAGFFSSASKVTTQGLYKDLVAASGKSSSDISLDAVRQLATSAKYRTDSDLKAGDGSSIEAASGIDLDGKTTLASLGGSLSLTYGTKTVSIQFDQVADVEAMKSIEEKMVAEGQTVTTEGVLAELINQKLSDEQITLSSGAVKASDRIEVTAENGTISFKDKANAGNSVYISSAGDTVKSALGLNLDNASEDRPSSITISSSFKKTVDVDNAAYLSGRSMNLSLDGTTKTIKLPEIVKGSDGKYRIKDAKTNMLTDYNADNYAKAVNNAVKDAFKGKVEVSNAADDGSLKLRFEVQEGSDLVVNTDVGDTLGLGRTASTYLNTSKTLGDLLGEDKLAGLEQATKTNKDGTVEKLTDSKGDPLYAFKINGTTVGNFSKNSTLAEVMSAINGNKEASVQVSYSQTTKNFLFTSKETGVDSEIDMGEGLAQAMFGSTEIPDNSGSSFAESYGVGWLKEGESAQFSFSVPGREVRFSITKDTTINEVVDKLNKSPMGMNHSFAYNKYTGQIEAKDKNSGAALDLKITDRDGDSVEFDQSKAPAVDYTPGQDAKFTVTVNGETKEMTRSSNSVNIDGLTITMKDVFDGAKDADGNAAVDSTGKPKNSVTFKSTTDSDKIVDAVKSMIEDYNAMMSEIKSAYATMPYRKSNGTFADYEPLTDEERQGMSESAIERYEEKAKQGILFGDRNLSNLYDKMRNIFNLSGEDGATLRAMGISTSYSISDGTQTITLDEGKLRDMLDSDPERVTELFTKTDGTGGIMQNMKTQLDNYAKTTGEPKGILIQQAGSPLSSLSLLNNSWQKEIDSLNTQIENWQDKLSDQVDRYTQQFTRLEMLINQMNSQSSTLAGLMGG
ncbi:MAG: flagellar filament capping protein FliD [Lawsonibacter sp.]|nr:flagellar filament capping protein FliD [Lawsonibacter sp.]